MSSGKTGKLFQSKEVDRSGRTLKETGENAGQENTSNQQTRRHIYSGDSIGPVEVVLNDPFLPESEKTSAFPKRLTLKLADSSNHGLSVTQYSDSSKKKSSGDSHEDDTNDSSKSTEEESESIGEPSPQAMQMKENIFAVFKRELPSFCVDNDLQGSVGKRSKKVKSAAASSRKNPVPRKFERVQNAAEASYAGDGKDEEGGDDVEEEEELDEENTEEDQKVNVLMEVVV